jgi:predicted phage terminase large subunit-like protein
MLKDEYLSHRYDILPSDLKRTMETGKVGGAQSWITSWDLTFKGKATSDYVVGQVWVAYAGAFYVIDQVRRQIGYMDTKQAMRDLAARYPWITSHVVEDAANAAAIDDDLSAEIPGLILEPHGGGCLARTQQVEGLWASGAVRIPRDASWVGGADGFIAEHLGFDGLGTRHDDQVSASGLALLHMHSVAGSAWIRAMKAAANG